MREAELDNVGAFTYSPEPGSGSEPLGDPVPAEEKEKRHRLPAVAPAADRPRKNCARSRGRTVDAIVEGPSEETEYLLEGRLRSQAPEIDGRLLITDTGGRTLRPGDVVPVKIEKTFDYDLAGAVVAAR